MSERARVAAAVLAALTVCGCAAPSRPASTPLAADAAGRPTLAVRIDGKGPFPFVLDTAAERTLVQKDLADSLGLSAVPGVDVKVLATGGNTSTRMLLVRSFASDLFTRRLETVFELPSAGITSARGILGMNVFAGQRLAIDFQAETASVGPSGPTPAGFTGVKGSLDRGDLVNVPLRVDGVPVRAAIDTGARRSMGNLALARALGLREGDARLVPTTPVTGASRDSMPAWRATVGAIVVGGKTFAHPELTFADSPVFRRMLPDGGPGLVLGVDLLHTLSGLAIDYGRTEVQFKP